MQRNPIFFSDDFCNILAIVNSLLCQQVISVLLYFTTVKCKRWTVKKAVCGKIYAFELWCWSRLLRIPWIAMRSNQSILKEISPGCSLQGLILKLKFQYFGHLIRRINSLEKTLMLGGIGGRRRRGRQRMRQLDDIIDSMDMSLIPSAICVEILFNSPPFCNRYYVFHFTDDIAET